jgi:LPS-assembly protein
MHKYFTFYSVISCVIRAVFWLALLLSFSWTSRVIAEESPIEGPLLGNEEAPWQIAAENLTYQAEETIVAEGDVVITRADQTLSAQKATYNLNTGVAEVSGDVRFEYGRDILTGSQGTFHLKNQTGRINDARLFLAENHFYITGRVAEKIGPDTYLVKMCEVTTCDRSKPDWSISAAEVEVTVEGYGTAKHAAFRILEKPVLYIPYMIFPAKTKRQSGLLPPRLGYSTLNGVDVEVPFFWATSAQTDASFYQRYLSERGYMQGAEFRYVADENSEGTVLFDILPSDKKDKDLSDPDDVEISPFSRTNDSRYWLRSKLDHALPLDVTAHLDADYVSDLDYLREFETYRYGFDARPDLVEEFGRPLEDRRSPFRTSRVRFSRDHDAYSLQAASSYSQTVGNPDAEDETPQPLAGLSFALLPGKVMKSPVYLTLNSNYDYVWREAGATGHGLSITPELTMPLWFGRYLEFEPFVRYTYDLQWDDTDSEGDDRQSKSVYEAGGNLTTNLERMYDIDWRSVKRLKHQIRPRLSYKYLVPEEEEDESPWFVPTDAEERTNRIAFSIESFLDARLEDKSGDVRYRQWATLTLAQGYDIDEARRDTEPGEDRRPFEPLTASLRVQPLGGIDFLGTAQWDHYDHEITFADLSLVLTLNRSGNRRDLFKFDYQFDEGGQESVNYWIDVNLAYGFSAGTSLNRDLDANETVSNSYWLGYQSQCWGVKLVTRFENDETEVNLLFNLLGLGEFKAM